MANPVKRLHRRLRTRELGPDTSMREPADRTVWTTAPQNGLVHSLVRIDSLAAECDRDSKAERWFWICEDHGRLELTRSGPEEWTWRTGTFERVIEPYIDLADAYGPLSPGDPGLVGFVLAEVARLGGPKEWNL